MHTDSLTASAEKHGEIPSRSIQQTEKTPDCQPEKDKEKAQKNPIENPPDPIWSFIRKPKIEFFRAITLEQIELEEDKEHDQASESIEC